eukprot:m.4628 g.4628  ORF g.4628 m.4628 type:complete len:591 (+) comp4536_c0_seq1:230-2002(+)
MSQRTTRSRSRRVLAPHTPLSLTHKSQHSSPQKKAPQQVPQSPQEPSTSLPATPTRMFSSPLNGSPKRATLRPKSVSSRRQLWLQDESGSEDAGAESDEVSDVEPSPKAQARGKRQTVVCARPLRKAAKQEPLPCPVLGGSDSDGSDDESCMIVSTPATLINYIPSPQKRSPCIASPKSASPRLAAVRASPKRRSPLCSPLHSPRRAMTCTAVAQDPVQEALRRLTPENVPRALVSREREREVIETFWRTHLEASKAGSLYISGKPGTGKTATIRELLHKFAKEGSKTPTVSINCMSVKEPRHIFVRILEQLRGQSYPHMTAEEAMRKLDRLLSERNAPPALVVIADEVDLLATRNNDVLYQLFQWPQRSRVILIGIANALDLTDRILPLLSKWNCAPETLLFQPYSKQQLVGIVNARLEGLTVEGKPVLDVPALQLCAAKVSSASGDIRQVLDLCRRTIELSTNKERHIKIMFSLFKQTFSSQCHRIDSLPPHQKLLLIALHQLQCHSRDVTFGKACSQYTQVCKSNGFDPEHNLADIMSHLVCNGLAQHTMARGKRAEARDAKVRLAVAAADIEAAFKTHPVFGQMLE